MFSGDEQQQQPQEVFFKLYFHFICRLFIWTVSYKIMAFQCIACGFYSGKKIMLTADYFYYTFNFFSSFFGFADVARTRNIQRSIWNKTRKSKKKKCLAFGNILNEKRDWNIKFRVVEMDSSVLLRIVCIGERKPNQWNNNNK